MLMHSIMDPTVGTFAGSIVELTDLLTEADLLTEDILIPTEDIPPASDNILVRFTASFTSVPPSRRVRFAPKSRHSASARVYEYTP